MRSVRDERSAACVSAGSSCERVGFVSAAVFYERAAVHVGVWEYVRCLYGRSAAACFSV